MSLNIKQMVGRWKRRCFKAFIKRIPKDHRAFRTLMRGRRLIMKQYMWLNFSRHPWERFPEAKPESVKKDKE